MGTKACEATGAPGTVAIPSGSLLADCSEYVSDANTGCEQLRRAYPAARASCPRVEIDCHEAGCTNTLALELRRSGPRPKSDISHVAGKPPMLAITNRDVNVEPSLERPSAICGKI